MEQSKIIERLQEEGVLFKNPATNVIDETVVIGKGTVVYPGVVIEGESRIGENCNLRTGCVLQNSLIGDRCDLIYVVSDRARVDDDVKIGPFVNLRPSTHIKSKCKVGDFVEIKNSNIDEGSKVPHLTYVGDADVGKRVNVGCGCVFVNYDGFDKHRTIVGDDVFLGCQTNLVAPVTVGNDAFTAAGSTITQNIPDGCFAIARNRQSNKPGWVETYRAMKRGKEEK